MKPIVTFLFTYVISLTYCCAQSGYEVLLNTQMLLSSNITTTYNSYASNTIDLIDQPKAGYVGTSISLGIRRPLSKRIKVQTGVGYQLSGLINQRVYHNLDPTKYVAKIDHEDILVPLQFSYTFTQKQNSWYGTIGMNTLIKTARSAHITRYYNDNTKVTELTVYDRTIYRNVNFAFVFGVGYEWVMTKNFNIQLQPTFACNLFGSRFKIPVAPINWHLYNFGITLGLVIK